MWEVEYTDEFGAWWDGLSEDEQEAVSDRVKLLIQRGPALRRPTVGAIKASRHTPRMKELVVESGAASIRILFAFDPRSTAILLLGGDKAAAGWKAWYGPAIEQADDLYDDHLAAIDAETD